MCMVNTEGGDEEEAYLLLYDLIIAGEPFPMMTISTPARFNASKFTFREIEYI